jgi:hypothetical protein
VVANCGWIGCFPKAPPGRPRADEIYLDLRRRASGARERNLLELAGGATRSTLGLLGGSSRRSLLDF